MEQQVSSITKDHNYFELQKLNIKELKKHSKDIEGDQYFNDYIEDEPVSIDLKIDGINKLTNLPIEIVGIYSYQANLSSFDLSSTKTSKSDDSLVNVIVNINSHGKQRQISFESQLLFMNNMNDPLVLVFDIKSLNVNANIISDKNEQLKSKAGRFNKVKIQHLIDKRGKAPPSKTVKFKDKTR